MHSDGLQSLLELTEETPDNFIAQVPAEMAGGHRLFGGSLLATAIRAASLTVADHQQPESLQYSFLAEGRLDVPVHLVVERSRDGRSMANRRVQLIQDGKLQGVATLSFAAPEPGCVAMLAMRTELPDPESLSPLSTGPLANHGLSSPFQLLELPVAPYTAAAGAHSVSRLVWARLRHPMPVHLLPCAIGYASDLGLGLSGRRIVGADITTVGRFASLNHSLWWHGSAADTWTSDDWLLLEFRPIAAAGSRGLVSLSIHTQDGRHIATAMQQTMMRVATASTT
jgi:acyl-CoA thioesterase-2